MTGESLAGRDLISLLDFDAEELGRVLELAGEVKANAEHYSGALAGRTGGMAAEIITTVCEKACDLLETPPARVTHADLVWAPAKLEPLSLITPERIANAARGVMLD